jgi:hypothetical protein
MLRQISWRQFIEWKAFADAEPFDEVRADIRAAQIVLTLINLWRGKGKPARSLEDVLLQFGDDPRKDKTKKKQTWQEQKSIGRMFYLMFNKAEAKKEEAKRKREEATRRKLSGEETPKRTHYQKTRPTWPRPKPRKRQA